MIASPKKNLEVLIAEGSSPETLVTYYGFSKAAVLNMFRFREDDAAKWATELLRLQQEGS